jgi:hypothetical protein
MNENLERDIEAIESEKKEFEETGQVEGEEDYEEVEEEVEREVDTIEISLDEDEINEWILKLEGLRESKDSIELELDDENDLAINFEEGQDE